MPLTIAFSKWEFHLLVGVVSPILCVVIPVGIFATGDSRWRMPALVCSFIRVGLMCCVALAQAGRCGFMAPCLVAMFIAIDALLFLAVVHTATTPSTEWFVFPACAGAQCTAFVVSWVQAMILMLGFAILVKYQRYFFKGFFPLFATNILVDCGIQALFLGGPSVISVAGVPSSHY